MTHTILLLQPCEDPNSRTYCDYETVGECIEGVCKIYEEVLRRRNSNALTITYDISQLFDFIDQFSDFCCMVYQPSTNKYAPQTKQWVKEKIYQLLKRAAGIPSVQSSTQSMSTSRENGDGAKSHPLNRKNHGELQRRSM